MTEPQFRRLGAQFHATPSELCDLIDAFAEAHELELIAERFFPTRVVNVSERGQLFQLTSEADNPVRRVLMYPAGGEVPSEEKPGGCFVTFGLIEDWGLEQTMISASWDVADLDRARLWKKFKRTIHNQARAGATLVGPRASAYDKSYRILPEAEEYARRGGKLVTIKDGPEYRLPATS